MSIVAWLILGLISGFVGSKIVNKRGEGLFLDIVLGIVGAIAGLVLGAASIRYIESLLYDVKATDATMLAFPCLTIVAIALLAAIPPVIRAVRIDPVSTLRAD